MIESDIYQALSPLVNDRVWPVVVPQDQKVWPIITFHRLDTSPAGGAIGADDLKLRDAEGHWSVFQVAVWADDYGDIPGLLRSAKTAMLAIPGVMFVGALDGYDKALKVWSSVQEYHVWGDLHEVRAAADALTASPITNFLQAVASGLTTELAADGVPAVVGVPTFAAPSVPGVIVDVVNISPGEDQGDERVPARCQVVAHCVHGFWAAADLAAAVMVAVRSQNRFGLGADVGAPEDLSAQPGQASPGQHGYDHWVVSWVQDLHVGTDVWAPSGVLPDTVHGGWVPDVGTGHEPDYVELVSP